MPRNRTSGGSAGASGGRPVDGRARKGRAPEPRAAHAHARQRAATRDELPQRDDGGHKGSFGTVVVVGGSATMLGAPCFAAAAALRSGAGLVKLALPADQILAAQTLVPSVIAMPIRGDPGRWVDALAREAVLAVGCGWGRGADRSALLRLLLRAPQRMVLDADGLALLAALPRHALPRQAPLVLTPHPGEYARLANAWGLPAASGQDQERAEAAIALSRRAQAVVVLKGARTVVSDGLTTSVESARNAALAIPGSGDVLSGIIAALLAQGMDALPAARLGVHLHAAAGAIWRRRIGSSGLFAMQLADLVPEAMRLRR